MNRKRLLVLDQQPLSLEAAAQALEPSQRNDCHKVELKVCQNYETNIF